LVDRELVLFGAATHDIGKAIHQDELQGPGVEHESAGRELLLEAGIDPARARFTETHAHWEASEATTEDLVVAMADKAWKGKRDEDLELALSRKVSAQAMFDEWGVFARLGDLLDEMARDAPQRLGWQARYGLEVPPDAP